MDEVWFLGLLRIVLSVLLPSVIRSSLVVVLCRRLDDGETYFYKSPVQYQHGVKGRDKELVG